MKKLVSLMGLVSFCAAAATGTPEERAAAVIQNVVAKSAGYQDLRGSVEMTLTDAAGAEAKRSFTLKLLERASPSEGDRSLIVFEAPADVKGTSVLSRAGGDQGEDEQWLFLPSAKRTKRISSANRSGSFAGSEFSFEDLTGNDSRKYAWKYVGDEACGEKKCTVLEATPKDASSAYSKRVLRLDEELRLASIDFFDRKGSKLKTLTYDEYRQLNGKFWRAQRWSMKNEQTGKATVIRFTAMKLGTGLTDADFTANKLGE